MPLIHVYDGKEALEALPSGADVVVCVPVFDAYPQVVQCLNALCAHTEPSVPILLLDDGVSTPGCAIFQ